MAENKKQLDNKELMEEKIDKEEANRRASVFFEDDEEITLRDGKRYKLRPNTLKDARKLARLLKTVQIDLVFLNFIPEEEGGTGSEDNLFEILLLAFKDYPEVDKDYIDNYVDLNLASEIIDIMVGLNGLKKSLVK